MIKGTGIDLFDSTRFALSKYKHDMALQILTEKETIRYRRAGQKEKTKYFSTIFTAKEALLKAFGCGLRNGSCWHDIDVRGKTAEFSRPFIRQKSRNGKERTCIHIASAGTKKYTITVAVLE